MGKWHLMALAVAVARATDVPSALPTRLPTVMPLPTYEPVPWPTQDFPTYEPSMNPTYSPTSTPRPTATPTALPTPAPTSLPTRCGPPPSGYKSCEFSEHDRRTCTRTRALPACARFSESAARSWCKKEGACAGILSKPGWPPEYAACTTDELVCDAGDAYWYATHDGDFHGVLMCKTYFAHETVDEHLGAWLIVFGLLTAACSLGHALGALKLLASFEESLGRALAAVVVAGAAVIQTIMNAVGGSFTGARGGLARAASVAGIMNLTLAVAWTAPFPLDALAPGALGAPFLRRDRVDAYVLAAGCQWALSATWQLVHHFRGLSEARGSRRWC